MLIPNDREISGRSCVRRCSRCAGAAWTKRPSLRSSGAARCLACTAGAATGRGSRCEGLRTVLCPAIVAPQRADTNWTGQNGTAGLTGVSRRRRCSYTVPFRTAPHYTTTTTSRNPHHTWHNSPFELRPSAFYLPSSPSTLRRNPPLPLLLPFSTSGFDSIRSGSVRSGTILLLSAALILAYTLHVPVQNSRNRNRNGARRDGKAHLFTIDHDRAGTGSMRFCRLPASAFVLPSILAYLVLCYFLAGRSSGLVHLGVWEFLGVALRCFPCLSLSLPGARFQNFKRYLSSTRPRLPSTFTIITYYTPFPLIDSA